MSSEKPREWVKYKDDIDFSGPTKLCCEEIHVIEKSAFDEVVAERDAAFKEQSILSNSEHCLIEACDKLAEEKDAYKKALEEIEKRTYSWSTTDNFLHQRHRYEEIRQFVREVLARFGKGKSG